jgi:YHS domain-containing protein
MPVNERCICDNEDIDPDMIRNYKGKTIAFCSEDCMDEWDSLSDKQKEAKVFELTELREE